MALASEPMFFLPVESSQTGNFQGPLRSKTLLLPCPGIVGFDVPRPCLPRLAGREKSIACLFPRRLHKGGMQPVNPTDWVTIQSSSRAIRNGHVENGDQATRGTRPCMTLADYVLISTVFDTSPINRASREQRPRAVNNTV